MQLSQWLTGYLKERYDILFPVLLCFISGILFLLTLLPGTGYWGDTAELQYTGKILGTTHPTGYPLYVMVNHVFVTLFPIGSLAYKANLLSAIFAVIGLIVLYKTLRMLNAGAYPAFICALIFGGTVTFWSQSVIAEVYSLNIVLAGLVIFFFLRWYLYQHNTDYLLGCAIFCLSLGNHITMVLFLPAMVVLTLLTNYRVLLAVKNIILILLFAVLGIAQYLYIVWRTVTSGAYLYVKIYDIPSFFACISGAESKKQMFAFSSGQFIFDRLPWFFNLIWNEFSVLLIIALFGVVVLKNRKITAFLALIFLAVVAFLINFSAFDSFAFFLPAYYIVALFMGVGFAFIYERVTKNRSLNQIAVISILLLLIPGVVIATSYGQADQSSNTSDAKNIEDLLKISDKTVYYVGTTHDWSIGQYINYYKYGEGWDGPDITYWYTPENNMERVFDHLVARDSSNISHINLYTSEPDFYATYGFVMTPVSDTLYLMKIPEEKALEPVVILNRFYKEEGFYWMTNAGMILVGSGEEGDYQLTFNARSFESKTGVTVIVNKEPVWKMNIGPVEGLASVDLHLKRGKNSIVIRADKSSNDDKITIGCREIRLKSM
jgi:hypothetical protein